MHFWDSLLFISWPQLQKTFPLFPFVYFGNLGKTQIRGQKIFFSCVIEKKRKKYQYNRLLFVAIKKEKIKVFILDQVLGMLIYIILYFLLKQWYNWYNSGATKSTEFLMESKWESGGNSGNLILHNRSILTSINKCCRTTFTIFTFGSFYGTSWLRTSYYWWTFVCRLL